MMHNPPHPGTVLNGTVIQPLKIGVTEAARRLGMSRPALSRILNGKAGISPDLAVRLEKAGQNTARFWLNLQSNYDLWQAKNRKQPDVKPLDNTAETHV